jgi:hypothetical protein
VGAPWAHGLREYESADLDSDLWLWLWLWLTDQDPDPVLFVRGFQDANKQFFSSRLFLKVHLQSKKSQNSSKNQGFSYFLPMEGSGSGSGSVQVITNPGPGGPKIYGFCGSGSTTLEEIISVKKDTSQINSG